jgi:hypothetical protein
MVTVKVADAALAEARGMSASITRKKKRQKKYFCLIGSGIAF